VQAAVLLAARTLCLHFALPHPSVAEVLAATGASRSRAYEVCAALLAMLPSLVRPRGRPAQSNEKRSPPTPDAVDITSATLTYVLQNPGCARMRADRQGYSDDFRRFVVQLRSSNPDVALEDFARQSLVPLGTLKSWLACPQPEHAPSPRQASTDDRCRMHKATLSHIETVLTEWDAWRGTFTDFTKHVRHQLRVPMGRQLIRRILEAHGVRLPRKRAGRSPDEIALRGAFETFFPGAQWVGDGKAVRVVLNGETFTYNLELDVDAHTGAWVGLCVRDTEDSAAVAEAFEGGVETTGAAPIGLLLDNKPSNHTPEVDAVLDPAGTSRIRATAKRPENKAHVEGAFGLFAQQAPSIELDTRGSDRSVARALMLLIATTFARATNHRPRADRGGLSRFELYAEQPTEEQIQQARRAIEERCRRQELARATREARQRPEVRALLDDHFDRLGLMDPERSIRVAIARYPLGAIVDGIAIFTGKRQAGTLPQDCDARYLLGIVRNVAAQREGEAVAEALLARRLEVRDQLLAVLQARRDAVCDSTRDPRELIADLVAHALGAERKLDRLYWLRSLAEEIQAEAATPTHRDCLFRTAAREINTTFRVPPRERQEAVRFLADRLVPIA
jgi:hypothetical protein